MNKYAELKIKDYLQDVSCLNSFFAEIIQMHVDSRERMIINYNQASSVEYCLVNMLENLRKLEIERDDNV